MGSRKRAKPNPAAESSTSLPPSSIPSTSPSEISQTRVSKTEDPPTGLATRPLVAQDAYGAPKAGGTGDSTPTSAPGKQVHKTRSWYGSWPRAPKSSASTQVARETILGGTSKPKASADFKRFEPKKIPDSVSMSDAQAQETPMPKIQEGAASAGRGDVGSTSMDAEDAKSVAGTQTQDAGTKPQDRRLEEQRIEGPPEGAEQHHALQQPPAESTSQRPASGWFGWLGRAPTVESAPSAPTSATEPARSEVAAPMPAETKPPETNPPEPTKDVQPVQDASEAVDYPSNPAAQDKPEVSLGGYWLWSWSRRSAPAPQQPQPAPATAEREGRPPPVKDPEDVAMQEAPTAEASPEPPAPPPKAGSTWAFWSRDTRSGSGKQAAQQGEQGQLAVMGENSETHPKEANSIEFRSTPAKEPPAKANRKEEQAKAVAAPSRESSSKSNKRERPQSMDLDVATPARPSTPKSDTTTKPVSKTPTSTKALPPNLLLPSFSGTYKLKDNPSILKQIAQLLLRTQQPSAKHVYMTREPPKIKKAIAIGVHGLFPANYLRPMIGQPTGTSIKFANHCAEAIRRWADGHGSEDCEIEKVALEGEGKIADRVENLWKLLLNWIDHIRNADLILVACHSQGVPVSIMLLAKLIELGIVTSAKVGVCAMAGVSLGPFPDYRSSMGILMGSAAELWEFADPQSEVSKRLEASVKAVLQHGVRLTYIGSIDDQLVPLESAIYAPAHHPYIFRAVFIDGRIHAPDFIAHLVGFALKLRNLGVSDHGLIRELSTPLAGSLYSGEGHSRLYDDEQVYDLAVTHALETADVAAGPVPCEMHHRQAGGLSNPNPYHLPWIMRGLLEEDFVKTELSAETTELVRQFDAWKPVTKALKDVKYRLEAVRSKL